jgi:hypothetical protein
MTIDDIRVLLNELSHAPDTQIDSTISVRLKNISIKENLHSKDIEGILDDCVYYSVASDFGMEVLDTIWKELKKLED